MAKQQRTYVLYPPLGFAAWYRSYVSPFLTRLPDTNRKSMYYMMWPLFPLVQYPWGYSFSLYPPAPTPESDLGRPNAEQEKKNIQFPKFQSANAGSDHAWWGERELE